jgi:translation initiation factor 1
MNKRRVVYSTDQGKHCPECSRPLEDCGCQQRVASADGIVRLQRQVKGRNGKPVTIITGLPLTGADLKKLAKQLKSKCGVGGSIEAQNIIIQGDKREFLQSELETLGYTVKLAGG